MVIKDKNLQIASAELLAMALLDVFPQTKILEAYTTPLGFGLDFMTHHPIDESAFNLIDERMRIIVKRDVVFESLDMMRENAVGLFKHHGQELLADRVAKDPRNIVPLVRIGDYYGFNEVTGPLTSRQMGDGKLLAQTTKFEQLSSHGPCTITSFDAVLCSNNQSLKQFFKKYKEQKRNDHQILGANLQLYFHPNGAIPGDYTWLPKGEVIKEILTSLWKNLHKDQGYSFISSSKWFEKPAGKKYNTPGIPNLHLDSKEAQYLSDSSGMIEEILRLPMSSTLPIRLAEMSKGLTLNSYRKNLGLYTSDVSTTDMAYCLCNEEQAAEELISSLQFLVKSINMLAIEHRWCLILNVAQTTGSQLTRDIGLEMLVGALDAAGLEYTVEPGQKNDRAPRIQARFIDPLGREWDGASLGISFKDKKGELLNETRRGSKHQPALIRRSLFASLERFVAILVEKYAGLLPIWLAPEQVRVIPIKGKHSALAREVYQKLLENGVRVCIDQTNQELAAKVFAVKTAKVPYSIIVGDNEQRNGTIVVCPCEDKGNGQQEELNAFIEKLLSEIQAKCPFTANQGTVPRTGAV